MLSGSQIELEKVERKAVVDVCDKIGVGNRDSLGIGDQGHLGEHGIELLRSCRPCSVVKTLDDVDRFREAFVGARAGPANLHARPSVNLFLLRSANVAAAWAMMAGW